MNFLRQSAVFFLKTVTNTAFRSFKRALDHPAETQARLLLELTLELAKTDRGKSLGIKGSLDYETFKKIVPVGSYDALYATWIEKQRAAPEASILSPGVIKTFERSSGSSGKAKEIPYNNSLLGSFTQYFKIWSYDVLSNGPEFETLKMFMSVSPTLKEKTDGLDGFTDDSEYLQGSLQVILKYFMAVPMDLKNIHENNEYFRVLCAFLVSAKDLEILSLWHPSFFIVIIEQIKARRIELAEIIKSGSLSWNKTTVALCKNPEALEWLMGNTEFDYRQIWPKLKFISVWDAANSKGPCESLKRLFPGVRVQGKGLLATEAAMTLPLIGIGTVPFLTEVFFEFKDKENKIHRLHELEKGNDYYIIISQKSGLIRYEIGDRVHVTDILPSKTPLLEFIGKSADDSDLVGEKLTLANIVNLQNKLERQNVCLLPIAEELPYYHLLVESSGDGETIRLESEAFLREHYHYRYAQELGQLGPLKVSLVKNLNQSLIEFFQQERSMKLGDIKLKSLISKPADAREILSYILRPVEA